MTILLFPGQGAQKPGMARDLADRFPAAADTLSDIDGALDTPLTPVMWSGTAEDLTLTHNAQPAILAHSAAVLSVVRERLGDTVVAACLSKASNRPVTRFATTRSVSWSRPT